MMTARQLFLVSLFVASLSGMAYALSWWTCSLAVISSAIIYCQVRGRLRWLLLGGGALVFGLMCYQNAQLEADIARPAFTGQITGVILPDTITIDGDQLKDEAQLQTPRRQTVVLYWTIPDEQTKQDWQKQVKPLAFSAQGTLDTFVPATNIGQFNRQTYAKTQNITKYVQINTWQTQSVSHQTLWQHLRYGLATAHARLLQQFAQLPQPLGDYATALLLGTTPASLYDENPGIQTLSLVHLFSVSGFQVSYLLMLLMAIGRRLAITRETVAVIGLVALWLYFVFTGMPAILVRAVVAGSAQMLMLLWLKNWSSIGIWAVSLLVSLAFAPQILLTLGGQLSFSLTLAMLLSAHLSLWQRQVYLNAVSLPLILAQQSTWHLLATPANFLALPVFGYLIVPLVLIGVCVPILTHFANVGVGLFTHTLDALAQLPGQIVIGHLAIGVTLLLLISVFFVLETKWRWRGLLLKITGVVVVLNVLWLHLNPQGVWRAFDIGQGDAMIVQMPFHQEITMIDTGGKVGFAQESWQKVQHESNKAATIIVPYLHSQGINHLDNLVLTHKDQDHIGNAKFLLQMLPVKRLIISAGMEKLPAFQTDIAPYLTKSTQVIPVTDQTQLTQFPFQIVHPFQPGSAENGDSVGLVGHFGGQTFFQAGDLDRAGEAAIQAKYHLQVDVLKFGHHGSKTATDPTTVADWHPKVGIISAGRYNRYGHPNQETLQTAAKLHMTVYNTQVNGMITWQFGWLSRWQTFKKPSEMARFNQ
ncbi:MAG TPA: DNA internalization-related competence protein ComEC/Rec2 [Lactobacillaceae bacterium]|jgi:competence protein ComEC